MAEGQKRGADDGASDPHPQFAMPFVMDCMPVGIGVFARDGTLMRSNPLFADMTGNRVSTLADMQPPRWIGYAASGAPLAIDDFPGLTALDGHMATPGHEFRHIDDLGMVRWFNVSAVPLRSGPDCGPLGIALVLEDIAVRKQVAARLAIAEQRIRAFSNNSNAGFWVADVEDGRFRFLNPAIERLWPAPAPLPDIAAWQSLVHPEDRERVAAQRHQVALGHSHTLAYRMVDEEGGIVRHLRETSFFIPAEGGSDPAMGGIVESVAIDLPIYLMPRAGGDGPDLAGWLRQAGYKVKAFETADALLAIADVLAPGCILVDVRDAVDGAADTVASLCACSSLPVVLLGDDGGVPPAIAACVESGGAILVAGLGNGSDLETALSTARMRLSADRDDQPPSSDAPADLAVILTAREMDVLRGLMDGGTNKSIARTLGLSPRTVEVHRARLMDRLQVRTLSALIRYVEGFRGGTSAI